MTTQQTIQPRVFKRAEPRGEAAEQAEGTLLYMRQLYTSENFALIIVEATGERKSIVMPKTWSNEFDIIEGMYIKAGWRDNQFYLEAPPRPVQK